MALYHFHADLIRRSKGQAAVAAAAYRAGEKLHDEYYGEDADYTRKGGVVYTEILLPSQAPAKYKDRETLWNAVEKAEEHPQAQLAYSYDIALQNELTLEENIALARKFVQEQFVSKGMVVDLAVHVPDKACANPHFHLLCPIRPIGENGQWGEKSHRVYELDTEGNKVRGKNGKYICHCVSTTGWGDKETLLQWREAWAAYVNRAFEHKGLDCRIDHRSNAERGIEELPTVHEGPRVRAMEAKGIQTEKGSLNRLIQSLNRRLREIRRRLKEVRAWLTEAGEKLKAPKPPSLGHLLASYYKQRNAGAWSQAGKISNLKKMSQIVNYLSDHDILTVDELKAYTETFESNRIQCKETLQAKEKRVSEIQNLLHLADLYRETAPVYEKLGTIKFKFRRQRFAAEHDKELRQYYMAARKLKPYCNPDGKFPVEVWETELNRIQGEVETLSAEYSSIWRETKMLADISAAVLNMAREQEKERVQTRQKEI